MAPRKKAPAKKTTPRVKKVRRETGSSGLEDGAEMLFEPTDLVKVEVDDDENVVQEPSPSSRRKSSPSMETIVKEEPMEPHQIVMPTFEQVAPGELQSEVHATAAFTPPFKNLTVQTQRDSSEQADSSVLSQPEPNLVELTPLKRAVHDLVHGHSPNASDTQSNAQLLILAYSFLN